MLNKKLINLLRGWPSPTLLPSSILLSAANRALSDPAISTPALQYAPDEGPLLLRQALSSFLSSFYRTTVDIDRITTTGGASQSFGIALGALTDPGYTRRVWVVEPTYFLAFRIIGDAGLTVESVEDADDGIDFEAWDQRLAHVEEQALRAGKTEPHYKPMPRPWPTKIYKNVFYCVPSFSNPTGRCMSLRSREQMVRLARKYDALIVTDDVYDCLWWDASTSGQPANGSLRSIVPRIVDIDRDLDGGTERDGADGFGNAMSNGSFSKICGPGVRTGWIEGTPALAFAVSQAGPTRSGGAGSNLTGVFLAIALQSGELQKHISTALIPGYQRRWHRIMTAISQYLVPLGVTVPHSEGPVDKILETENSPPAYRSQNMQALPSSIAGGYFLWLRLPKGIDATYFADKAKSDQNVIVQTESQCRAPPSGVNVEGKRDDKAESQVSRNSHVRLCLAWEAEEDLVEGIERLGLVLAEAVKLGPEATGRPSAEAMKMLSTNQFR